MEHPAVLTTLAPADEPGPRVHRYPMVAGRHFIVCPEVISHFVEDWRPAATRMFATTGSAGWWGPTGGPNHTAAPGDEVDCHGRRVRFERGETLVVDPARLGPFVVFNRLVATAGESRWRGFAIDDDERRLVEVVRSASGLITSEPPSAQFQLVEMMHFGVHQPRHPLPLADAIVSALVRHPWVSPMLFGLDLDGGVVGRWRVTAPAPQPSRPASSFPFYYRLGRERVYRQLESGVAPEQLLAQLSPAPAADVAAWVRALRAAEWALEESIREQALTIVARDLPELREQYAQHETP